MKQLSQQKEDAGEENRASFMKRFVLKITPDDMFKLDFAYDLAKSGHSKQFRDSGVRYFEHVRGTAIILIDELGISEVEINIGALLHDTFEDTFLLTAERAAIIFGKRVADLVSAVSKPKKGDPRFSSDSERHQFYFKQLAAASVDAKILKLADRLQNMRTLGSCLPEKQTRKINETHWVYFPLLDDIAVTYPEKARYLADELERAINRL
jgi:GTP pyrophosphokinase